MTKSKARLVKGRAVINLKVRAEAYLDSSQCKDDLIKINTFKKFGKLTGKKSKRILKQP
ncbi:hypothetical protein [Bacillus sp. EB106-08-02-XG196]|uniref:hypothetical protein n=1 Tax=Bacillus sp. EB106-08-02-XG196 TaxID=2737049 RepID=UPI00211B21DE|nr:hypothetical protein [Bacillus sp. EB106-08-02-XG196]